MTIPTTERSRLAEAATLVALLLAAGGPAQVPLRFDAAQPIDDDPSGNFFSLPAGVDLDGDGDRDWIYAVGNWYAVRWLENQGGTPPTYVRREVTRPGSVIPMGSTPIAADFDDDGDLDILVAGGDLVGAAEAELSWFEHPDDSIHSLWEKRVVLKGTRFGTCFAEDLNGDGRPDIASLQRPVGYFLNSPAGGVQFSGLTGLPPVSLGHAVRTDLDGDTKSDFVASHGNTTVRLEVDPDSPQLFSIFDLGFPGEWPQGLDVADVTGDGRPDAVYGANVLVDHQTRTVVIIRANEYPEGTFGTEHDLALLPPPYGLLTDLRIIDMDFDGRNDLVLWETGYRVYFLPNGGGVNPFSRVIVAEPPMAPFGTDISFMDIDQDGALDLVQSGGVLEWHRNSSSSYIRKARLTQDVDDGFFAPGESGSLVLSIGNLSPRAVGSVTVNLSASSSGFIPGAAAHAVGTVVRGGTRDVVIPYEIAEDAACGTTIEVVIDLMEGDRIADHHVVPLLIGDTTGIPVTSRNVEFPNLPLQDPAFAPVLGFTLRPVTRTLTVTLPPGPIASLVLDLDITHAHRGDLKVELTSPSGWNSTVYEGEADDAGTSLTGPFEIDEFSGLVAAGDYELTVTDRVVGDRGTLSSWGLTVTSFTANCESPRGLTSPAEVLLAIAEPQPSDDVNQDGIIDAADLVPVD